MLERAQRRFGVAGLWSHEETGNGWTYARDRRVAAWAKRRAQRCIAAVQEASRLAAGRGWLA